MARVKYYDPKTERWVYADDGFSSGGSVDLTGIVTSVNGEKPDKDGNVQIDIPDTKIPEKLPNPYALTINGSVYDGSEHVEINIFGSSGVETILSDNLLDLSLLTRGQIFYYGSDYYSLIENGAADSWYGFIPLRGAGTYRTKYQAKNHNSKRIVLVNDNNEWVATVNGVHGDIPEDNTRNWLDYEFTVTQAHIDAGATKIAFDVWTPYMEQTMIVKDREYPTEYLPYGYIEVESETDTAGLLTNVLYEKTAVFLGDSICAGDIEGSEYDGYGWAGLIGESNGMIWKNYGRNGGTIVQIDNAQFERWLTTQLVKAQVEHPNADYVIFEGGSNDAFQLKEAGLGVISDDFATFDISTFSGAMESLILQIITAFPNAQIGYIVAQKMGDPPYTSANIQRKYFDRAVEICQKWGIPVIDLWSGGFLNPEIPYHAETLYVDGQHLTLAGYQRISPQIEAWMRNMTMPGAVSGGSAGGGGSYAPADWNAAEGEEGHILNRTHSSEYVWGDPILPETTFSWSMAEENIPIFEIAAPIVPGGAYKVIWNGKEHIFTATESTDGEYGVAIGNLNMFSSDYEDTGEDFLVVYQAQLCIVVTRDMYNGIDGSATICIISGTELVNPIDSKYLSNALPFYIHIVAKGGTPYTTTYPREVKAAMKAGRPLIAYVEGALNNKYAYCAGINDYTGMLYFISFNGSTESLSVWEVYPNSDDTQYDCRISSRRLTNWPLTIDGVEYDGAGPVDYTDTIKGMIDDYIEDSGEKVKETVYVNVVQDSNGEYTADKTVAELLAAYENGHSLMCLAHMDGTAFHVPFLATGEEEGMTNMIFTTNYVTGTLYVVLKEFAGATVAYVEIMQPEIPEATMQNLIIKIGNQSVTYNGTEPKTFNVDSLKNPHPLTVNGVSYDGSEPVDINLETPDVDSEEVNELIDTKLHSVASYGAKGDGSTDDTKAFQDALAEKRVVTVPGGTYKLSSTLVIRENCCLELSQDTILQFTQTSGNCIEMRGSATLRGNHAVISVAYAFTGNVICMDTAQDGTPHNSIPPYLKSDPVFKRQRFVYDVNIIKPDANGFSRSLDGKCNGTAIYMSAEGTASIRVLWAIILSGIRISGGFTYGIRAANFDKPGDYVDNAWNHDMRVEAVIEACEIGVSLENCNGAHLDVTIQPCKATNNTIYAKWGFYLNDCRYVDLMRSRVWDWKNTTLWTNGGQYQHIALFGNCRGLLLDDFLCSEETELDIRELIYTDTPANFDTMTILQEPANKWFKSKDDKPFFFDGTSDLQLMLKTEKFSAEQAEFIRPADGYYTYEPDFTNLVEGYTDGVYLTGSGTATLSGYVTTDFIPIDGGSSHVYRIGGEGIVFKDPYNYGRIAWYDSNKNPKGDVMPWNKIGSSINYPEWVEDETVAAAFSTNANVAAPNGAAYFCVTAKGSGKNLAISIDEAQVQKAVWHGEPRRMDESIYAQKTMVISPSGKVFELTVSDSGVLSATEFAE